MQKNAGRMNGKMKLDEFEILNKVIEEIKKLEIVNWKIININLSYLSSGGINIKLQKQRELDEETK